jgi:hypothetical protein
MVVVEDHQEREPSMNEITTIGLDLGKNVFQAHDRKRQCLTLQNPCKPGAIHT